MIEVWIIVGHLTIQGYHPLDVIIPPNTLGYVFGSERLCKRALPTYEPKPESHAECIRFEVQRDYP